MTGRDVAERTLKAITDYRLETFREPTTDGSRLLLNPSDWDDLCSLQAERFPESSLTSVKSVNTLWGLMVDVSDSVPAGDPRVIGPE